MTATFRVSCSRCGELRTSVVTADSHILAGIPDELEAAYPWHHPAGCGGRLRIERKDHKRRGGAVEP